MFENLNCGQNGSQKKTCLRWRTIKSPNSLNQRKHLPYGIKLTSLREQSNSAKLAMLCWGISHKSYVVCSRTLASCSCSIYQPRTATSRNSWRSASHIKAVIRYCSDNLVSSISQLTQILALAIWICRHLPDLNHNSSSNKWIYSFNYPLKYSLMVTHYCARNQNSICIINSLLKSNLLFSAESTHHNCKCSRISTMHSKTYFLRQYALAIIFFER